MIDAVGVGGGDGGGAVGGTKGGEAKAHDDGVGTRDADGFGKVVDAGGEEQILTRVELGIDGGSGVFAGMGNVELGKRNRTAGC